MGVLPLAAAIFLCWVVVKSVQTAPAPQNWSLAGVLAAGLVLMLAAQPRRTRHQELTVND